MSRVDNPNNLCGVICINKPRDFTSFDVIAITRRAAGTRKIGHGGTLDPMATGVLPIFIGRAAKTADLIPSLDKRYVAGFKLGLTSETEDIWGTILTGNDKPVTREELLLAVGTMQGNIMQVPPMYSAVKVGGKKLYELARQGIEIEREARPITVHSIELLSYDEKERTGVLDIHCSKGTYIRTIISDIGAKLGTGAVMTSLQRTLSNGFTLADCTELEDVRSMTPDDIEKLIIPTEKLFSGYEKVVLNGKQRKMFMNGVVLDTGRMNISYPENTDISVYDESGVFLGTAVIDNEKGIRIKYLNVLN
ncbi:MAG: tRNA pseudouridine(55) synthase TruB [Ruminiclostridium sp.]|nr:tRNA pseudouridine(55) synthase TruB [Ruminiclostridium sp.]